MGLLDTWEEWKQDLSPYAEKAKQSLQTAGGQILDKTQDYVSGKEQLVSSPGSSNQYQDIERPGFKSGKTGLARDLNTAIDKGGEAFVKGKNYAVKEGSKELDKAIPKIKETAKNAWEAMFPDEDNAGSISDADKEKILNGDKALHDQKTSAVNQKDIPTLEKVMGISFDKAKDNWKDKGGMEGLMSNPAFSLGLALMQSSANGKTINQGILDNFIKSAKISEHYKDRIKARGSIIGPASEAEIGQVEAFLGSKKIGKSGFFDKVADIFTGSTNEADYRRMLSDVAQYNNKRANELEAKGKKVVKDESFMEQSILEMKSKGLLKTKEKGKKKGLLSNFNFMQTKIEGNTSNAGLGFKAEGGPVQQGRPYVVGEKGPEIIIPRSDGDVLTNDDSQIYAMLLASNPQLQKVSRVRAQKIMRNRFPEYFEG